MDGGAVVKCTAAAFVAGTVAGCVIARQFHQKPADKAEQKDDASNMAGEQIGNLQCSACNKWKPQSAFVARQARRRANKRKCSACVDAYHKNNPPAHPAPKKDSKPQRDGSAPLPVTAAPPEARDMTSEPHDTMGDPLRLARKAETVLRARNDRVLLVLENCSDDLNHVAILRTCEALGVMRVFLVEAVPTANVHNSFKSDARSSRSRNRLAARAKQRGFSFDPLLGLRRAQLYCGHLDVRSFGDVPSCLAALEADGREIWATDLAQEAIPLTDDRDALGALLPDRLAIVLGSEGAGVSSAMLSAATKRVFLPMWGFTESFNVSVAAALVLQRLLDACVADRGKLPAPEIDALRRKWYDELARSEEQRAAFKRLADCGGAEPFVDTRRPQAHRDERVRYSRDPELTSKLVDGAGTQDVPAS
jgi:tRNA G18 (ribose-2'-O)-methylase SpoU